MRVSGRVPAVHGGDLDAIARRYGVPRERLVDFSANLNALGPPPALVRELAMAAADLEELRRYPDPSATPLRTALGRILGVDAAAIVVSNGAAALLDAAVRVRRLTRCLLPQPAFSEDQRVLDAAGTAGYPLALDPADGFRLPGRRIVNLLRARTVDGCLLTNPHNPSGSLTPRPEMEQIVTVARAAGALTIVDEAFIDFAPGESVAEVAAQTPDTIVIRSLTKFFAVPALRVGYAVCEPELARALRAIIPPWPVTALALRALTAVLDDVEYAERSRAQNIRERQHLKADLEGAGLRVFDSAANFLLCELPLEGVRAPELVSALVLNAGLVVRDCSSFEGLANGRFIRVAVRARSDNERLASAISHELTSRSPERRRSRARRRFKAS